MASYYSTSINSAQETNKRVHAYPHIVPYTHTTAFMVIPSTSPPAASLQLQLTAHKKIVPVSRKIASQLPAASSSVVPASLSYLADPFAIRTPPTTACTQQLRPPPTRHHPEHQHCNTQKISQPTTGILSLDDWTNCAGREKVSERHQYYHQHQNTAPRHVAAASPPLTTPHDKWLRDSHLDRLHVACTSSPRIEKLHQGSYENCFTAKSDTAVPLKRAENVKTQEKSLVPKQTNYVSVLHRSHDDQAGGSVWADKTVTHRSRREQYEDTCPYPDSYVNRNGQVGAKQPVRHVAAPVCNCLREKDCFGAPQKSPAAALNGGVDASRSAETSLQARSASESLQKPVITPLPSSQTEHIVPVTRQRVFDETDVFTELRTAEMNSVSLSPPKPRIGRVRDSVLQGHERQSVHQSAGAPEGGDTQVGIVAKAALKKWSPIQNHSDRHRNRCCGILTPMPTPRSTPSPARHENEKSAATLASTANKSSHAAFTSHYSTNDSPSDKATVTALSPLSASAPSSSQPQNYSSFKESVQRHLDKVHVTPEDLCAASSLATSPIKTPTFGDSAVFNEHQHQQQRRQSWSKRESSSPVVTRASLLQRSVSQASLSDDLSSPPLSVSLPVRGRLSFDTAVDGEGEDMGGNNDSNDESSNLIISSCSRFGQQRLQRPTSSSVSLISPPYFENDTNMNGSSPLHLPSASGHNSSCRAQHQQHQRQQQQEQENANCFLGHRCQLIIAAEAAAREWLELNASVQLHHIACEERLCYRSAEAAQYRRRLHEQQQQHASSYPAFSILPEDLTTPPAAARPQDSQKVEREVAAVFVAAPLEASMQTPTSPLSYVKAHRRMPSVASLPPLSPRRKEMQTDEEEEEVKDEEEADLRDVVSLPSPSPPLLDACSLSSSEEPLGPGDGGEDCCGLNTEANNRDSASQHFFEEEAGYYDGVSGEWGEGREQMQGDLSVHPDVDDRESIGHENRGSKGFDIELEAAGREGGMEKGEAKGQDGLSANFKTEVDICALPVGDVRTAADSTILLAEDHAEPSPSLHKVRDSIIVPKAILKGNRRSPPLRIPLPQIPWSRLLQDVVNDEEDARYLLTGECPPPHVFQRWADRFLRSHPSASGFANVSSTIETGQQLEQSEDLAPSSDVAEPSAATNQTDRSAGQNNSASLESTMRVDSPEASIGVSKENELVGRVSTGAAASSSSRDDDQRSTSRQRQCSERNRAWVMESFLEDVHTDVDDGAMNRTSCSGALWGCSEASNGGAVAVPAAVQLNECNATGRYAPDPQIFTEGNCLRRDASSLSSSSALANVDGARAELLSPPEMNNPSVCEVTPLPEAASAVTVSQSKNAISGALTPVVDVPTACSSFMSFTYPSEDTYDAPFGSERDAWQMLMDDFIERFVKLMSNEA